MNKYDLKLLLILLVISVTLFLCIKKDSDYAYVYYESNLVMKIDLSKNDKYTVDGKLGEINLEVKNGKIRVISETSKNHICSKMDYTNSIPIICLPNKVVIDFKSNELDTVM